MKHALILAFVFASAGAASAQPIPLGNEPILTGTQSHTSDHKPWRSSWVPATSNEMLDALSTFSNFLSTKLGFNPRLHELERFIHYVGPDSPIKPKYEARGVSVGGWWGHCNGESAAVTVEAEPVPVTRNNVSFTQDQLKATLAEAYYEAGAMVRGTRSFLNDVQYSEAKRLTAASAPAAEWRSWYKSTFNSEAPASYGATEIRSIADRGVMRFEDMNPAEMHRALRTVIGKAKIPMVFETSASETVWNWAAWAYNTDVKDTGKLTANGLKIYDVATTVETMAGPKNYTYELYIDSGGRIKDGKWTGSSVTNHPDFIWSATDPRFHLNEFMAKAVSNNLGLTMETAEIANAVRTGDQAGLKKFKGAIAEVWEKAAPSEVSTSAKMTDRTYRTAVELVKQWNSNPSLEYRYGNLENFLEAGLAESYGRGKNFSVDLYKELGELLPDNHRVVDSVEERLRKAAADPTPMDKAIASVKQTLKREAAGAAQFAAAYLLKEGFKAIETGDPEKMRLAVKQLATPGFWGSLAVFSISSRIAEVGLTKLGAGALTKAAVPLAVGMAVMQLISGRFSVKDVLIGTGAYLATGFAVNFIADSFVYPILFAAGPPGWIAAGAYTIVKLAVSLYLGEKLEHWLQGLFARGSSSESGGDAAREGVTQKLQAVAP